MSTQQPATRPTPPPIQRTAAPRATAPQAPPVQAASVQAPAAADRLVPCEDCGWRISPRAAACPRCGCPLPHAAPAAVLVDEPPVVWKFHGSPAALIAGWVFLLGGAFIAGGNNEPVNLPWVLFSLALILVGCIPTSASPLERK